MPVAFDASSSMAAGSPTSPQDLSALTIGSGSNRALICYLFFSSGPAFPGGVTCTWDSGGSNQAMTQITNTQIRDPNTNHCTVLFGLVNPVSGNKTLRVTWSSGTPGSIMIGAASWTGVDQTGGDISFPNGNNNTSDANTTPTVTITTQIDNAVTSVMEGIGGVSAVSDTALVFSGEPEGNYFLSTGASHVLSGTVGIAGWVISGTDIQAVAAAAPGGPAIMGQIWM